MHIRSNPVLRLFLFVALCLAASNLPLSISTVSAVPAYPDVLRTLQFESLLADYSDVGNPRFLKTDSNNNLYVSDTAQNKVHRFAANGAFVRSYGTGATGTANGDIAYPRGSMVVGGTLYVVDSGNGRVQLFNAATGVAQGTLALQGFLPTGHGIAHGPDGNLYIADPLENRIEVYSTAGSYLRSFGGPGTGDGKFNAPYDIAFDSLGYVYVSDSGNDRIQKFSRSGAFIRAFDASRGAGQPMGIHIDRADTLWVADFTSAQLFRFDQKGNLIGEVNAASSGMNTTKGGNMAPIGVAVIEPVNQQPIVYVSDWYLSWVSRFRPVAIPLAHTYEAKWSSGNGQFNNPFGAAVDKYGNVYVADHSNDRVQKFDRYGNHLLTIGYEGFGNGLFRGPIDIAIDDPNNLLYVAEYFNNRVQVFTTSGAYVRKWGSEGTGNGQFRGILGIALDAAGYVYTTDEANHRVQKFDADGTFIAKWGSLGTGFGQLTAPTSIKVDSARDLVYVLDAGNNRVQVFTTAGTQWAIYSASTSGPGQLSSPVGLELDGRGSLYVADLGNNRIVQFDTNGNYLAAFGTAGSGNGQFDGPTDVAFDPATGQLYVTEAGNDRVQRFGSPNVKHNTVGIYRPSGRTFYLRKQNTTGFADFTINLSAWSQSTDLAVSGDWNCDGIDTVGLYRQSNGTFYLRDNNRAGNPHYTIPFGAPGDLPVVGDWDGDGCDGIGVYRAASSAMLIKNVVEAGSPDAVMFIGTTGDRPVAGDWNGDGQDTLGVYRPSLSRFYLTDQYLPFGTLTTTYNVLLGNPNDVGFSGDWIEQGSSGIGVFRPTNGITYLKNAPTSGFADVSMIYGLAGDGIVAGEWGPVPGETISPTAPQEQAPIFEPGK